MRRSTIERKTKETQIKVKLDIDGSGKSKLKTPLKFLNHMLELFTKHGCFDLEIAAKGDIEVDQHHTVEDIGITLGQAFNKALGSKKGINRAGFFAFPMDESLSIVAVDISGRPYLKFEPTFKANKIGDLDSDLVYDFFEAFCNNLKATLHIKSFEGRTDHHKAEAIFKAFAKAMKMACSKDKSIKSIPSTKGLI